MVSKQYTPEYFPNWTQVLVCFKDMDALSHFNNILFNSYFKKVRIRLLLEISAWLEHIERKRYVMLRKSTNEYLTPILNSDTLFNYSSIDRVDASRINVLQVAYNSNTEQLSSTAETIGTWFDLQTELSDQISTSKVLLNYLLSSTPN